MNHSLPIAGLLNQTRYNLIFWLTAGSLFALNYYLMAHLPGERNLMCVIGGGLTFPNILFAGLMSAMAGLVVVGFVETTLGRRKGSVRGGSSSLAGLIAGGLTSFCTLCSLPVISLFGFSLGLGFFTDYAWHFRAISVLLLGMGIFLVNRDLQRECLRCAA